MKLFESIKPLFANKPLTVVMNKVDVLRLDELSIEKRRILNALEDKDVPVLEMSTITEVGVMDVKIQACERLLAFRVDQKIRTKKVTYRRLMYRWCSLFAAVRVVGFLRY